MVSKTMVLVGGIFVIIGLFVANFLLILLGVFLIVGAIGLD